jgi:SAM-dependent methyltransferase
VDEFLQYYFAHIDHDTLSRFGAMAGVDNSDVPARLVKLMTEEDDTALFLQFLLDFYVLEHDLKRESSEFAIVFSDFRNACYPFFINYALDSCSPGMRRQLADSYGSDGTEQLCQDLRESVALRNWFRNNVSSDMQADKLMALYEIVSLQNFSSGGESTFCKHVLPRLDQARGPILDAGCGSGLSTLLASRSHEIFCFDGCLHRVRSAGALFEAARTGRNDIIDRAFSLAAKELAAPDLGYMNKDMAHSQDPKITLWNGLMGNIPCNDQFFNTIICLDVLEHVHDPGKAVAELGRVADREASLYVSVPTEYCSRQQFALEQEAGQTFPAMLHLNHFNRHNLERLFGGAGFQLADYTVLDSLEREEYLEAFPNDGLFADLADEPVPLQILAHFIKKP